MEGLYRSIIRLSNNDIALRTGTTWAKIYSTTIRMSLLVLVCPILALFIWIDRHLKRNVLVRFPRTSAEVIANPQRVFSLVFQKQIKEQKWKYSKFEWNGGSETEPDKNATVIRCTFWYTVASGAEKSTSVFIKMSTARLAPIFVKAIGATFTLIPKEILFFDYITKELADPFPIQVPKGLYCAHSRLFDRTFVATECVNMDKYMPIADWQFDSVSRLRTLHAGIAKFHAASWGLKNPGLRHVMERRGASWLDGAAQLYMTNKSYPWKSVWNAIHNRLCEPDVPMCLSHGDCRPGNMLFNKTDEKDIIMCDWEAVSVTPFMWDVTYSMVCGLDPAIRRKEELNLIQEYLKALPQPRPVLDHNVIMLHRVMMVIVNYFGWILVCIGGVGD
eukprot:PhF_6_TR29331/c0_g1_i3/m.43052